MLKYLSPSAMKKEKGFEFLNKRFKLKYETSV